MNATNGVYMQEFKLGEIKFEIASPCEESWDDMSGDDKCRHCALCDKNVYNFESMDEAEILGLLKSGNEVCARVFAREDGKVLLDDCSIGLRQARRLIREKRYHNSNGYC